MTAGELLVMPLHFQLVRHYQPLLTGLAMAPQGIVGFLGASSGARIVKRVGHKELLVVSAISAAGGLLVLGLALGRSYPLLLAGFMLAGYGTASGAFGAMVLATHGVADEEQRLGGGLVNMSRQVGAAVGVAVAAAIIGTGVSSGASVAPDRSVVLTTAAAAILAAAFAFRGIGARAAVAASEEVDSMPVEARAPRRPQPQTVAPLFLEYRNRSMIRRDGAGATIADARSANGPRKE